MWTSRQLPAYPTRQKRKEERRTHLPTLDPARVLDLERDLERGAVEPERGRAPVLLRADLAGGPRLLLRGERTVRVVQGLDAQARVGEVGVGETVTKFEMRDDLVGIHVAVVDEELLSVVDLEKGLAFTKGRRVAIFTSGNPRLL